MTKKTITKREKFTNPRSIGMAYIIGPTEQRRTTEKKKEFIKYMDKSMGIIRVACEAVGVSRTIVYKWLDKDPKFRAEINRVQREQVGEVEDRLLKAILADSGWAITLYLKSKHPNYRPKQDIYVPGVEKSLEDLIQEYKKNNDKPDNKQGANRDTSKDTK